MAKVCAIQQRQGPHGLRNSATMHRPQTAETAASHLLLLLLDPDCVGHPVGGAFFRVWLI